MVFAVWMTLLLSCELLLADTIYLKDGRSFKGFMESINGNTMVFSGPEGKIEIPSSEVMRIDIDYTGIPVCYTSAEESENENCEGLLQALGPEGAVIFFSKKKRITVPLKKIVKLEFSKISKLQKILPLLSTDLIISLKKYDGTVHEGKITSRGKSRDSIEMELNEGERISIHEKEILGGRLIDQWNPNRFYWYSLIPGVHQHFRHENLKSGIIVGGLIGMGSGFYFEYASAVRTNTEAHSDILLLLFGLNQDRYANKFRTHQNGQRVFAAGMVMLYAYHLLDVYGMNGFFQKPSARPVSVRVSMNDQMRQEYFEDFMHHSDETISLEILYRY